ncbi:hypothetical protein KIW84_052088 [Lathyrus oleraceus]|uniref:RIN4 pathogenic type III effector avirulence factor Avr cleavage site domain-containing protein n=1 Tax=Pisum sativum TaxID=3888 RepID=A0A9D4WLR7_PEA|nr:hypothetical protein KIW84_052088 [Pisum sativum]
MQKNTPWLSVPQFGEWDQKGPLPDYSMDFSKIREMRKQNKTNASRASLGNEEEFTTSVQKDTKTDDNKEELLELLQLLHKSLRFKGSTFLESSKYC